MEEDRREADDGLCPVRRPISIEKLRVDTIRHGRDQ